ncbi:hypothetical protein ADEAN_000443300 [Angomonas deanei]|uniref:Uncharacterized protein n=1 Tax=Angomonas deanei TaxID=59799 RepID=A0A7G2CBX4_9TRYP|nr:hypothetical protein ADEAN_000443300 [Angomonas deanei]
MNKIKTADSPALKEAVDAVFTPEEKQKLKENLIEEQINQAKYLQQHPEIETVFKVALSELVKKQPENCVEFFCNYLATNDLTQISQLYDAQQEDKQRRAKQNEKEEQELALSRKK